MLVCQTFATAALEDREAARIYAAMAIVPQNMGEDFFQATAQAAGLSITTRDVVSSEWRERWADEGSTTLLEDLLGVARMRSDRLRRARSLFLRTSDAARLGGSYKPFPVYTSQCPVVARSSSLIVWRH
jgi:hypothetical protein